MALESIQAVNIPPGIELGPLPTPRRVAPYAMALEGEAGGDEQDEHCFSTGKFVVLYDPQGQEGWQGEFRIASLVKADLDPQLAADPCASQIIWSWLSDAIRGLDVRKLNGTVTLETTTSFEGEHAEMAGEPETLIEIHASWTAPDERLGRHLEAWMSLLATAAGLPSLAPVATGSFDGSVGGFSNDYDDQESINSAEISDITPILTLRR